MNEGSSYFSITMTIKMLSRIMMVMMRKKRTISSAYAPYWEEEKIGFTEGTGGWGMCVRNGGGGVRYPVSLKCVYTWYWLRVITKHTALHAHMHKLPHTRTHTCAPWARGFHLFPHLLPIFPPVFPPWCRSHRLKFQWASWRHARTI